MIKIKPDQLNLLCEILRKYATKAEVDFLESNQGYTEDLKLIEKISNALSIEFVAKGLTSDSEPNEYGLKVDDLISYYSAIQSKLR